MSRPMKHLSCDMWEQITEKMRLSLEAVKAMERYGKQAAEAEKDYQVIHSQKTLLLKESGLPATLIPLIVKGDPEVAEARQKRDIADVMYKTAQELVNVRKIETKILNEQMSREWNA